LHRPLLPQYPLTVKLALEQSLSYTTQSSALQVELSTVCNALCLSCARTSSDFNSVRPEIPPKQFLDPEVLIKIVRSPRFLSFDTVEYSGVIDEPLVHPQFIELNQEILRYRPDLRMLVHTNGGTRGTDFYRQLAGLWNQFSPKSKIRFSIDGLHDTNHIYRQNVSFKKALQNMQAFIDAGGIAAWQFVVFPWNKHQIDDAIALAKEVGCREFYLRPDRSFASKLSLSDIEKIKSNNKQLHVPVRDGIKAAHDNMDDKVVCKYREENRMIFLSWDGGVWPCCFYGNIKYESESKRDLLKKTVFDKHGENFNNVLHHDFDEVLEHPFYSHELVNSWKSETNPLKWRCVAKCRKSRKRISDEKADDKSHYQHIRF
jgi:MoaA/NifB/PqqE/SkfB family radical SAM enzyme